MLSSTSVGYGRVPAGNGLVVADRRAHLASVSNSNQDQAHTASPTYQKFSSDIREPEPFDQIPTRTTVTPDDRDQTDIHIAIPLFYLITDRPIRDTHLQRVARHRRRSPAC